MGLLTLCCVLLAAVLHSSTGQGGSLIPLTDADITACVNKHNDLRRSIYSSDMQRMVWNTEAAATAANWAQQCQWKHSAGSQRRISTCGCGENLFRANYLFTLPQATQVWFDEKKDFTYGSAPINGAVIGHFTQVVWSKSSQLGCAVANCGSFYFGVCHYCPPGNIVPRLYTPYAQGAPCSSCPDACENGLCTKTCVYEDTYSNCPTLGCGTFASACPVSCKCK